MYFSIQNRNIMYNNVPFISIIILNISLVTSFDYNDLFFISYYWRCLFYINSANLSYHYESNNMEVVMASKIITINQFILACKQLGSVFKNNEKC